MIRCAIPAPPPLAEDVKVVVVLAPTSTLLLLLTIAVDNMAVFGVKVDDCTPPPPPPAMVNYVKDKYTRIHQIIKLFMKLRVTIVALPTLTVVDDGVAEPVNIAPDTVVTPPTPPVAFRGVTTRTS